MRRISLLATFGLLAVTVWPALAQEGQSSLRGRVLDESGGVLPGVVIVVTHQGSGMFRQVTSNADGSYFVTGIVPGTYRITSELEGFRKYERSDVLLEVGRTQTLDITLAMGALGETVTVTGASPLIDVTSQEIGGNIGEDELLQIPVFGRNWIQTVALLPGIQVQASTASFGCESFAVGSVSGSRGGSYAVDGGGNNDDYLGASCSNQTRTATEAVQEFQVLTGQYDAEFGRTAGAVVNAITKQGTNTFRGSAIGTYTHSAITAKDFFAAQQNIAKPKTSMREWGGTLGGPIKRDKAHFFYSLERISWDQGRTNTFPARPELNFSNVQKMLLWNHMIRGDHQINPSNTWTVRYLREVSPTFDRVTPNITLASRDQEFDVDHTSVVSWNSVFGNTRFNTIRFGKTYEKNGFNSVAFENGAHLVDLPPTLSMLTFTDGPDSTGGYRINNAHEVSDSFSWFVPDWGGDHELKFGGQLILARIDLPDEGEMNGVFSFATDRAFDPSDPGTYPERLTIRVPDRQDPYLETRVMVLFAQDKWKRQNLTLSLGVRYDLEVHLIDHVDLNPLVQPGEYPVDKYNLAPRFGFVWNPGGAGKAVVRGGYGIFHEKVPLNTIMPLVRNTVFNSSFMAPFPTSVADPGPSRGQFPTDPMLVNGPVVNRALLNALYPPGSTARNTGTVYLDNPDRVVPYAHSVSFGYERQLGSKFSASVDYKHDWNRDNFVAYNLNPALRVNTSRTGRLVRTDLFDIAGQLGISPFANPVYTFRNEGVLEFDGLNAMLEKRYDNNWSARVSYGLGYARGNANNDFQLLDDLRLDRAFGPVSSDRRHNVVVSGRVEIPRTGGLSVSGTYRYMTGSAMTIHNTAVDADQNGVLMDPLPAGRYCGEGQNAFCTESKGGINGAYGPSFQQADLRFTQRLRSRRKATTIEMYFEAYNIFNTANFANPSGDMRQRFLLLTALRGGGGYPRQGQFGVRLGF